MAEPKTEIERRLDRIEEAIRLMSGELGPGYASRVEQILTGKDDAGPEE